MNDGKLIETYFPRLSLAYARAVPKQLRRLIECFLLLKVHYTSYLYNEYRRHNLVSAVY